MQVINNTNAQARTERGMDGNGNEFIKVIIDQAVGKVDENILRGGSTGRALQSAFGLQRSGVPVSG